MEQRIVAVCISQNKGERKKPVDHVDLKPGHGVIYDAHAADWHRQISLLAIESIAKMKVAGLDVDCGDFAENLTTEGIDLPSLPVGSQLFIGEMVIKVTQIGKECHHRCAIYHQAGDCVMPKEGIFAEVLKGGRISPGDSIRLEKVKKN